MKTTTVILSLLAHVWTASGCLDVVISLDTSCSITDVDREVMREIVLAVVGSFETIGSGAKDYQVAMLTFNRGVQNVFYLNEYSDKEALLGAIRNASLNPVDCRTTTFTALDRTRTEFFSLENGDRPNNKNFHLMMTDGVTSPASKYKRTIQSAGKLKESGAESMVVAFENANHKEGTMEWEAISTIGILRFDITGDAEEMAEEITAAMSSNEKLSCVRDVVEKCGKPLDIVYILDVSNSIRISDLQSVVNFLKDMTSSFDIGNMPYQTQVAAMSFNSEVFQHFQLNDFDNLDDVLTALDEIPLVNAIHTRTDSALLAAKDVFFTEANGDRPNITNVIVLATDGRTYPVRFGKKTLKYATEAKEAGDKIFVLGLPNDRGRSGRDEWEKVASEPISEYLFELETFAELDNIVEPVAEEVCIQI